MVYSRCHTPWVAKACWRDERLNFNENRSSASIEAVILEPAEPAERSSKKISEDSKPQ